MASFADNHGGYCTCTRDKCTDDCATYRRFKPKPITNSMRIRTMTDEELAEWLMEVQQDIADYQVRPPEYPTLKASWLDWLRQEAGASVSNPDSTSIDDYIERWEAEKNEPITLR